MDLAGGSKASSDLNKDMGQTAATNGAASMAARVGGKIMADIEVPAWAVGMTTTNTAVLNKANTAAVAAMAQASTRVINMAIKETRDLVVMASGNTGVNSSLGKANTGSMDIKARETKAGAREIRVGDKVSMSKVIVAEASRDHMSKVAMDVDKIT